ncbi:MAG: OFA family MFS transporter, partial [Candidatus Pacebacteria bacterium]|nr:OFA family MFS transporter [Candidatus Paceibacterota bacterium]
SVCQWRLDDLLWIYALFFLFLGGAAATRGTWLERVGPRHAGVEAAFCWGGGLVLAGIGAGMHQLWLMCLGAGVIGGIGLGVGYISPVSLLIKWFPDRRGVAVGMAIMGFGGGAMIGSPLASLLMTNWLGTPAQPAIWQTLIVLGLIYFVFMLVASLNYRLPPSQWQPKGWVKPDFTKSLMTARSVHVNHAHRTVQFWLLWFMLFFNVSAGISILAIASNMFQKLFGGKLIGLPDLGYGALSVDQQAVVAGIGAGFVGALSIGNILGRIFWAGLSDRIGRKQVYYIFFGIGLLLYIFTPLFASMGIQFMFVAGLFVIISMYGGGFASLPAYIADLFGTTFVGAIHGRILTAWSAAGVVGTFIIPYVVNNRIDAGLDLGLAYSVTFYILAGFLLIGAGLNFLIHTLDDKHFMSPQAVQDHYIKVRGMEFKGDHTMGIGLGSLAEPKVWLAWSLVVLPMLWGAWFTVEKMVSSLK